MKSGALKTGWIQVPVCGACGSGKAVKVGLVRDIDVVKCRACDTVRITQVVPPDVVYSDGYHLGETWGDDQDVTFDYTAADSLEYEMHSCVQRLEWLERFISPGKLLDVGGGVGTFALAAKQRGWDPTVLEPVPTAIEFVKGLGLKGIVGGIEDIDPKGEPYDVLSLIHVLEHFTDVRGALEHAKSALRPGALIFLELPHWDSVPRRRSGEAWVGWRPGQHVHLFTEPTLRGLFERVGLEVVKIKSVVLLWDGLIPDYYAYLVGALPLLRKAVKIKRKLLGGASSGTGDAVGVMPPSIGDQKLKRLLLKPPLDVAARIEQWLGVGENLRAVARVPDR
ncbi:MAG: class I SAM-dependent methyltransferase [Actinomycetota bacterium]